MYWIRFTIVLLLITLLNAGNLLNGLWIHTWNIRPDFLLIALVFFAINCTGHEAIIVSFAIGFAADISGSVMGPYFIAYGMFGTLLWHLRKVIIINRAFHQAVVILAIGIAGGCLAQMLIHFKTHQMVSNLFSTLFWTSFFSGLIAPFMWQFLSIISNWLGIRKFRTGRGGR